MQEILEDDGRYGAVLELAERHHRHDCPFPLGNEESNHADTSENEHRYDHRARPFEINTTSRDGNEKEQDGRRAESYPRVINCFDLSFHVSMNLAWREREGD